MCKTIKAQEVKDDSRENLVLVRRSSGEKEWMTKEKLAELNKQRALKREQLKYPVNQATSNKTKGFWSSLVR